MRKWDGVRSLSGKDIPAGKGCGGQRLPPHRQGSCNQRISNAVGAVPRPSLPCRAAIQAPPRPHADARPSPQPPPPTPQLASRNHACLLCPHMHSTRTAHSVAHLVRHLLDPRLLELYELGPAGLHHRGRLALLGELLRLGFVGVCILCWRREGEGLGCGRVGERGGAGRGGGNNSGKLGACRYRCNNHNHNHSSSSSSSTIAARRHTTHGP